MRHCAPQAQLGRDKTPYLYPTVHPDSSRDPPDGDGKTEEAVGLFHESTRLKPDYVMPYYCLSELAAQKVYSFTDRWPWSPGLSMLGDVGLWICCFKRSNCMPKMSAKAWLTSTDADELRQARAHLAQLHGGHLGEQRGPVRRSGGKSPLKQLIPDHPICRGWKEWEITDEYYMDPTIKAAKPLLKVTERKGKEVIVARGLAPSAPPKPNVISPGGWLANKYAMMMPAPGGSTYNAPIPPPPISIPPQRVAPSIQSTDSRAVDLVT